MADKPTPGYPHLSTNFDKDQRPLTLTATPFPFSSSLFSYFHPRLSTMAMASSSRPTDHSLPAMAPPPLPAPPMEPKKLDISSLMSPPDAVLDSFSHNVPATNTRASAKLDGSNSRPTSAQQPLPMSPPVSPFSKPIAAANAHSATPQSSPPQQQVKDPVLYPVDDNAPSPSQLPLFAPSELEHRRIVDEHVRARSQQGIFTGVAPPRREDYELALMFHSQVMKHYTTDRKAWLRQERALLEADRRAGTQRYHAIMPAKPITARPSASNKSQRADRVGKSQGAPRQARHQHVVAAATTLARPARPVGRVSATPEPARRVVAPNREDKDFGALPNYCPPLNSLPKRPNSLKVDWKGQPIDLSNDPHVHLLHPDEVMLAGNLRLDCATYLTSKRRIFERRLLCLRTGKEFRKTDAQQACKIDVNKASKLWTAFERVGWLDAGWVREYL